MVCPHSCAAGGGLHPDGVQDLLRHLEELLAPAPLARLRPPHGVAPGRQELQDVDLMGRRHFDLLLQRSACLAATVQARQSTKNKLQLKK